MPAGAHDAALPLPETGALLGKDNVNREANWSCPDDEDLLQIGSNGVQAGLPAQR